MNRCAPYIATLALAALAQAAAAQAPSATDGQALQRSFPANALRGTLVFGAPPAIQLNGVAGNLASGYRIHGLNNLILMSAQLTGMKFTVDYTTDVQGQVFEVWILSASEIARQPWPTTAAQAAAWTFDPIAQTWTTP